MRAVALAAGRGIRLMPLTQDRPKPMLPIAGRPILEHILSGLEQRAGIREFVVVIGHRGEVIRACLGDGGDRGWRIRYVAQGELPGTGAAARAARDEVPAGPFFLCFGDILTDPEHYALLLRRYREQPCDALLGLSWLEEIERGGAVERAGDRIRRIVEKPPPGTAPSHWNQAGISIFTETLWPALESLSPTARGEYELTTAVEAMIEAGRDVRGVELPGFWSDVGSLEELERARREFRP
jgi:NDP-sugar pyrophosphorylase family protein